MSVELTVCRGYERRNLEAGEGGSRGSVRQPRWRVGWRFRPIAGYLVSQSSEVQLLVT